MTARRYLVAGERGVLVELADLGRTLGLFASLTERPIVGVGDILPAARTVLIDFEPELITRAELIAELERLSDEPAADATGDVVEVEAVYDGADLAEVAGLLGIGTEELIARHTAATWRCAFAGFAPGFGYLAGDDPVFDVPRRASPRTKIPAGAVALAGRFSGIYPRESPGGWQLIGRSNAAVWDVRRDPPALLRPGTRVRFVARDELPAAPIGDPETKAPKPTGTALIAERAGLNSTFQDAGRSGYLEIGVSRGGAVDRAAMRLANELVGNAGDEAILEIPYGAARFAARGPSVVAITGARAPIAVERAGDARSVVGDQRPIALDDGDVLRIGAPEAGLRCVLAVRGGFAVDPVLGSRSTDTLGGLGPCPVTDGDFLPIRPTPAPAAAVAPPIPWADLGSEDVEIVLGPRDDWFTADALATLTGQPWVVTPQSDRVGLRLAGARPLTRAVGDELPSEGVPTGALQVPPSGQPILFLADHPVTGGYPVIATVRAAALGVLAQARPGTELRFRIAESTKE